MVSCNYPNCTSSTSVENSQKFLHLDNYSGKKIDISFTKSDKLEEKSLISIPNKISVIYCQSCYSKFL